MLLQELPTIDLLKMLVDITGEIYNRSSTSKEKLSYFDKQQSEIEHEIEITPLSASTGYQLAKELQRVRMLRRLVKRDISTFDSLKPRGVDIGKIYNQSKSIESSPAISCKNQKEQEQWSNYERLGKVTHVDVENAYSQKYGTLEFQMNKLQKSLA